MVMRMMGGGGRAAGVRRGALSLQNEDPTPQDGWGKTSAMGRGGREERSGELVYG